MNIRRAISEDRAELFEFHQSIVGDPVRTESLLHAIVSTVQPGDVVVEVGTGTGVLALFAIVAGARQVFAIEQEPIIDVAMQIAEANGVADRIEFFAGKSTEIDLPEMGDVLVTETIGNAAFDEGILTWVADARSRLIKPNARILPQRLALIGALLELPRHYREMQRLSSQLYTFDLSPLRDLASGSMFSDDLNPVSLVSRPGTLVEVDLRAAPENITGQCQLTALRDAMVHATGLWFEALLSDGITLTNAPPNRASSWNQGIMMLDKPLQLEAGDKVELQVSVSRDGQTWEHGIEKS